MSNPPSMQEVIRRLNDFWASQGCLVWQPHSEKVGAGTMNPATVLRVLGPEPWNVAYMEPSFRADDGRYAENPNRMQMHNQYQVILKPDPGNSQELYLASLEAMGLDPTRHDIRFVEDNWEAPALGAWGLGWEVWLDGQEITQFTYFQQAGSLTLDPISVEITYGLDRLVMYLQHKQEVWEIDVDGRHSYGEVYRDAEVEHCVYNFELADVERLKQLFAIYQAEAATCIERGLVTPAHDYVLRQSHTFNLLDARGAVGVTERAKFFADMRVQARAISELYVKQREREEYPWLPPSAGDGAASEQPQPPLPTAAPVITGPQDFLLELGSEELPAHDVVAGIEQLRQGLARLLAEQRLAYADLQVTGTPRRLVAYVTGLEPSQPDEVVEKRGPALERAYSAGGMPTAAAQGFARGQGVPVDALEVRDDYVYAVKRVKGRATWELLPDVCRDLLDGLRWAKAMRWNSSNVSYPRPLRWIVALYGEQVVPFRWAGVESGRVSRGPRFADAVADLGPGEFTTFRIGASQDYFGAVTAQGVVVDRDKRRQLVGSQIRQAAAQVGGTVVDDPELLDEVVDLIEAPHALLGRFDETFLSLPMPVLISVMKKHQRYFAIFAPNGAGGPSELMPYFVTVANSAELRHPAVVREGNEGVIRARYADAAYFFRQDTARPLGSFSPRLGTLTFHAQLGSMLDKVDRLARLVPWVAEMLGTSGATLDVATQAAALSKADLVTSMVVEMTSLQGVMGEIYALESGESPEVARAIREHYLPRFSGDANPATPAGLILSLADKLDSLAGLFAVGAVPTGSADPFGLRRAALGIVHNLLAAEVDFNVVEALAQAAALQPVPVESEVLAEVGGFVERRLQGLLLEMGYAHDVVEAVLAVRGADPCAARRACTHLTNLVEAPWWTGTFTAYARCARIVRGVPERFDLDPAAYQEAVERPLHDAYLAAETALSEAAEPAALLGEELRRLEEPVNTYFDNVLVNAEVPELRRARLALVQGIADLPSGVADLSKLQGF